MLTNFSTAGNLVAYHQRLLEDAPRVEAYRHAIRQTVRPGDVVLDIGAGTGLLAFLACEAGARKVYAIEAGEAIGIARALVRENGLGDTIELVAGRSTEIELPEPADVLVTETLWAFGLGEGLLAWAADARERLLRPAARFVPEWIEPVVVPVQSPSAAAGLALAFPHLDGVDLSPLRDLLANTVHSISIAEDMALGPPRPAGRLDVAAATGGGVEVEVELECVRPGTIHGVGGWFRAGLAPGVVLTSAPSWARRDEHAAEHWPHVLFPAARPVEVGVGASLTWSFRTTNDDATWSWRLGDGPLQSTFYGMPLDLEAGAAPRSLRSAPTLSEEGAAARDVLAAIDGVTTTAELAERLAAAAPGRFRSRDDATRYVLELVARFAPDEGR